MITGNQRRVLAIAVVALSGSGCDSDLSLGVIDAALDTSPIPMVDAASCSETTSVDTTPRTPQVLIINDRSWSMIFDDKWTTMSAALSSVVTEHAAAIDWGLMLFPAPSGETGCMPGEVTTAIGSDNAAAQIADDLVNLGPTFGSGTPTDASLRQALEVLSALPDDGSPRYVLLASDGTPYCNGESLPIQDSVDAVAALAAAGFPVYVLGYDVRDTEEMRLRQLAAAGGADDYYNAGVDVGELSTELGEIVDSFRVACTYELGQTPSNIDFVDVFVGEDEIPRDMSHNSGWDYDAASNSITLYGDACENLQSLESGDIRVNYCDDIR